jgi:hypothetical protein
MAIQITVYIEDIIPKFSLELFDTLFTAVCNLTGNKVAIDYATAHLQQFRSNC